MALVVVIVDPGVVEKYRERNPEEPEVAMATTLAKFQDVDPGADKIVLSASLPELRAAVSGPLNDEEDVAKLVKRGGTVALKGAASGVYVPLTENQKKRVREEADRLGVSETQALQAAIKEYVSARFGPF